MITHNNSNQHPFSPTMSSLSSLDTITNNPETTCRNSHAAGGNNSSSCSINKRFVSVLIDKDEDYITKRNATFDLNDVHRFRNATTNLGSSHLMKKTKASATVNSSKPSAHKSNSNRRKFYRWSKCKRETDGSTTASGSLSYQTSPQRIASRLGLTSSKKPGAASGTNVVGMV
jgi:hypothetical protein